MRSSFPYMLVCRAFIGASKLGLYIPDNAPKKGSKLPGILDYLGILLC